MDYLVQTEGGKVKGRENGGVIQFHGIPYAKPPVGDRRFALPDPELTWEGVYDASFRRPMAPQGISDTDSAMGSSCLDAFCQYAGADRKPSGSRVVSRRGELLWRRRSGNL